jgi:hypothetical protein
MRIDSVQARESDMTRHSLQSQRHSLQVTIRTPFIDHAPYRHRSTGRALHMNALTSGQGFMFRLDQQGACPPPLRRASRRIHPSARRVARIC